MKRLFHSKLGLLLIIFVQLMTACVNEASDVEKVTYDENLPVESTLESLIYYSENAKMQVKAFAPEMNRYIGGVNYSEMPKGIDVVFYDSTSQEGSRLTANYAIDKESEFIMEAKNKAMATT